MIVSRTPHRISFFGGGTDYPKWYLKNGGIVIGTAINKYCFINIRYLPPFFTHKHRIVYSSIENVNTINEIDHPSVRETLKYMSIKKGVAIHHDGDIPARSGMGSSSAFTVGLLNALNALQGYMVSQQNLATTAIHIEQKLIQENVGSQDQCFAAYGGFNAIKFHKNGEITIQPVIMPHKHLDYFRSRLMLFYSGTSRIASAIAGEQIKKTDINKEKLIKMTDLAHEALEIFKGPLKNFHRIGRLLNQSWKYKKSLSSKISNTEIDMIYNKALKHGALGGKLLGAGGGGFMMFYVEPKDQPKVKRALKDYLHIPFSFDFSGSKIIVYNEE